MLISSWLVVPQEEIKTVERVKSIVVNLLFKVMLSIFVLITVLLCLIKIS
ncbi:hypothetical protein FTA_0337 [Francisella tularensis subsp. holarctica FTNF002-00]|nr:hypothetical protein FTA_0337 [Francisella tularensis subsp. holarctica FTNF002-00]ADA78513.1 hypothetical protein NE061598_04730 [Francisella tularensis subsp. tularensis NE061598]KFJ39549.1 hypothetical protein DR85_1316 [Francisella tularensis]